jgi:TolB protein
MKRLLLIIFPVIIATLIILMVPSCRNKSVPDDVDSTADDSVSIDKKEDNKTKVIAKNKIAFSSDRDGNDEIYIMNVDGSEQTRLTDNPGGDSEPCFSP